MQRITIIGAGAIGCAIQNVLSRKPVEVEFWDKDAAKMKRPKKLENLIPNSDFVFLCTPAKTIWEIAKKIAPLLHKKTIVVSLAKGIDPRSGKTMDSVLGASLPRGQRFAILGGPMLASELTRGRLGAGVVASLQVSACNSVKTLFCGTSLTLEASQDTRSVALLGVIKNIYTIALGVVDGMGLGGNAKGKMLVLSLREMEDLLEAFGGSSRGAQGTAGLGDLVATGWSQKSRNYQFGYALGKGKILPVSYEGSASLPFLLKRLGKKRKQYPILNALATLVRNPKKSEAEFGRILGY